MDANISQELLDELKKVNASLEVVNSELEGLASAITSCFGLIASTHPSAEIRRLGYSYLGCGLWTMSAEEKRLISEFQQLSGSEMPEERMQKILGHLSPELRERIKNLEIAL